MRSSLLGRNFLLLSIIETYRAFKRTSISIRQQLAVDMQTPVGMHDDVVPYSSILQHTPPSLAVESHNNWFELVLPSASIDLLPSHSSSSSRQTDSLSKPRQTPPAAPRANLWILQAEQ
jgi:hypothetical protein